MLVGKTEEVDMAFTRAHGVARLLVGVLDIDFVPDMVYLFYRGEVFPLEIEFEDVELFADVGSGADMDMHEGDGDAGAREDPTDEAGRERANGPSPVAQLPGDGSGVESPSAPAVPMNTLRFGSFEPASAPPRLWSDRVESDDSFECLLPPLELDVVASPTEDVLFGTPVGGVREVESQVGPTSPTISVVSDRQASTDLVVRSGEGSRGQAAPASPFLSLAPVTPATPVMVDCGEGCRGQADPAFSPVGRPMQAGSASAGGGSPRQAASAPATPVVAVTTAAAAALGGAGAGGTGSSFFPDGQEERFSFVDGSSV